MAKPPGEARVRPQGVTRPTVDSRKVPTWEREKSHNCLHTLEECGELDDATGDPRCEEGAMRRRIIRCVVGLSAGWGWETPLLQAREMPLNMVLIRADDLGGML